MRGRCPSGLGSPWGPFGKQRGDPLFCNCSRGAALPSAPLLGGHLHWQRKVKALPSPYGNKAPSAEVEMTAYVLLAYLSLPNVSAADMATAAQIVRWLSKQQNPYGGFASTQVTPLPSGQTSAGALVQEGARSCISTAEPGPSWERESWVPSPLPSGAGSRGPGVSAPAGPDAAAVSLSRAPLPRA